MDADTLPLVVRNIMRVLPSYLGTHHKECPRHEEAKP